MIASTFELLINKQQFPKTTDLPEQVLEDLNLTPEQLALLADISREVIQGYFLTISNLTGVEVEIIISLRLVDSGRVPSINREDIAALFDIDGENKVTKFVSASPDSIDYSVTLPANDTGQLIVQANPKFIFDPTVEKELRGYVDITSTNEGAVELLLTPEHRATFYRRNKGDTTGNNPIVQLDQVAYALPTATGGSLFTIQPS